MLYTYRVGELDDDAAQKWGRLQAWQESFGASQHLSIFYPPYSYVRRLQCRPTSSVIQVW